MWLYTVTFDPAGFSRNVCWGTDQSGSVYEERSCWRQTHVDGVWGSRGRTAGWGSCVSACVKHLICSSHCLCPGIRATAASQREGPGTGAAVVQDGRPQIPLPGGEECSKRTRHQHPYLYVCVSVCSSVKQGGLRPEVQSSFIIVAGMLFIVIYVHLRLEVYRGRRHMNISWLLTADNKHQHLKEFLKVLTRAWSWGPLGSLCLRSYSFCSHKWSSLCHLQCSSIICSHN